MWGPAHTFFMSKNLSIYLSKGVRVAWPGMGLLACSPEPVCPHIGCLLSGRGRSIRWQRREVSPWPGSGRGHAQGTLQFAQGSPQRQRPLQWRPSASLMSVPAVPGMPWSSSETCVHPREQGVGLSLQQSIPGPGRALWDQITRDLRRQP